MKQVSLRFFWCATCTGMFDTVPKGTVEVLEFVYQNFQCLDVITMLTMKESWGSQDVWFIIHWCFRLSYFLEFVKNQPCYKSLHHRQTKVNYLLDDFSKKEVHRRAVFDFQETGDWRHSKCHLPNGGCFQKFPAEIQRKGMSH